MEIKNYFAQDAQGNIMPSANCYLYLPGTTTLATGLVDGNGTPISNPFLASSIGQVTFGAPNGVYDLRISQGARDFTIEIQCADILQALNETASFLGARSTPPTTRADGTPLQVADRYLNTTDQIEYIYKSSGWVANNLDGQTLATSAGASRVGAILQDGSVGNVQQSIDLLGSSSGSSSVGWDRTALSRAIRTAGDMLNAQRVNAMEKADFAGGYTVGGDPTTWDWAPAIKESIALCVFLGGGIVELPSIDMLIGSKSTHPAPFSDPTISGYGISIPNGVTLVGTGKTRIVQGYLGTSSGDRIALVSMAGTVGAGLRDVEIVGSLSAVGFTYGLQLINASASRVSNVKIRDTSFSSLSMACIEGALVSGRGTSDNLFMDLECINAAIDAITVLNGPGVNDAVPTRAPMNDNTFFNLTIRDARVGANNAIAMGIRRANRTKIYNLRMLRVPEGGVVIESGASYTEIYGIYAEDVGSGSGAAVVLHYHVSDGNTAGAFLPGVGNKIFGGTIKGGGRAFLHKGDHDTLHVGINVVGSTFRAVGTDNVDTSAGSVANPAINPMRITYSDSTFDGLFNVDTSLGNTEPGLTFGHGSGHKVTGGRISNFKVGISDSGDANVYSDIAFTRNERDVSTPNTTSKAIVRNCGANLNSTVVQQNVALAGLIRPTDAAFGAFNSGVASLGTDPTSIGNDDIVAIVTATNRGFATIPAFGYVGYPDANLRVRIRAKATGGACSVQTQLIANGVTVSTQTAQTVPVGGWAWYTFSVPINTLVDVANCAWNLRSAGAMAGTLSVDAFKIETSS